MTVSFKKQSWTQSGVQRIIKPLPGENQVGVLAPEVLTIKKPSLGLNLTSVSITQWELLVESEGFSIPVTGYCQTSKQTALKPAVVYFHGGGWRVGSRKDVEAPLRLLAEYSGAAVFSVEYRLAPEYRYPCATDDCWQALKYIHSHAGELGVDRKRIVVAGDSAGGNMAAACSRRDRNFRTSMIWQQILIYPVLAQIDPVGMADYHYSLDQYCYDDSQARWIIPAIEATRISTAGTCLYVGNQEEALFPDASPLLDKNFAGLPKTTVICAEYDYLTQQSWTYAKQLAKAGVDVTMMVYMGMTHGFMNYTGVYPQAEDLQREVAALIHD